jgi:phosphatidylserine decarboxylase
MKLHKEGYGIIIAAIILYVLLEFGIINFGKDFSITFLVLLSLLPTFLLATVIQFFRVPKRDFAGKENDVICPADGKIVVIEEVEETEYFKDRRIQISIFMSPTNVHANFNPVSGEIVYTKYHPGKFLVAWHPKSSTENERTTIVTKTKKGTEVLFRQVAGALARRICFYVKEGQEVQGGAEFGFIKFGSRIDLFLPLNAKIHVTLNQKVKGQLTKLAEL